MRCTLWIISLAMVFLPVVSGLSDFVPRIPNGDVFNCSTCHISGDLFRNDFNNQGQQWTVALAMMDSDSDGFSNGVELQDPGGTWVAGEPNPGIPALVSNPADASSFPDEGTPTPTPSGMPPTFTPTPPPGPTMTPTAIPPTPTPTVEPSTPTPECIHSGDVIDDDEYTAGDSQRAFAITMGTYAPSFTEFCEADCNGDDFVTAGDAQIIFSAVFGLGNCVDPL